MVHPRHDPLQQIERGVAEARRMEIRAAISLARHLEAPTAPNCNYTGPDYEVLEGAQRRVEILEKSLAHLREWHRP